MAARYQVDTAGDVALVGATAKTIVNYIAGSNALVRVLELGVSFDGTSSSAEPVEVGLGFCTQATAGTSTSHTIIQTGGPTRTPQGTAQRNYTVEPTVITIFKRWLVRADGGLLIVQFPLGREPEQITTADGIVVRCIAPVAVNAQSYLEVEEG